jgi:hypothetical protein
MLTCAANVKLNQGATHMQAKCRRVFVRGANSVRARTFGLTLAAARVALTAWPPCGLCERCPMGI